LHETPKIALQLIVQVKLQPSQAEISYLYEKIRIKLHCLTGVLFKIVSVSVHKTIFKLFSTIINDTVNRVSL